MVTKNFGAVYYPQMRTADPYSYVQSWLTDLTISGIFQPDALNLYAAEGTESPKLTRRQQCLRRAGSDDEHRDPLTVARRCPPLQRIDFLRLAPYAKVPRRSSRVIVQAGFASRIAHRACTRIIACWRVRPDGRATVTKAGI